MVVDSIEVTILRNLLNNPDYLRKVIPFLRKDYFTAEAESVVFDNIASFVTKYSTAPTKEAIAISIQNSQNLSEGGFTSSMELLYALEPVDGTCEEWLLKETEEFCKRKAVFNAIMKSVEIMDGKEKMLAPEAIPDILTKALATCFDDSIGHDWVADAEMRYDGYCSEENKIPFGLDCLNKATNGGVTRKTLNCFLAQPNAGKTLTMIQCAVDHMMMGYNVLYVTLEMSESAISQRFDANMLNWDVNNLKDLEKSKFLNRIQQVHAKSSGKLIVKDYPTSSAHAGHFQHLLDELKLKKNFVPDVVYFDYVNICAAKRASTYGNSMNSYTLVKMICEELRALASVNDFAGFTSTQTVKSAVGASDMDMKDVSESFGLAATVDFLCGIMRLPELDDQDQVLMKVIKSRYSDAASVGSFLVGMNRPKMQLYDVEKSAQEGLTKPNNSSNMNPHVPPVSKIGVAKEEASGDASTPPWQLAPARGGRDFSNFKIGG